MGLICGVTAALLMPAAVCWAAPGKQIDAVRHGIAMHGAPGLPAGFAHFPHVDPKAPKGGRLTLGKADQFNSLNPFIIKGDTADGVAEYVYETLMARAPDEPFTLYGQIGRAHV